MRTRSLFSSIAALTCLACAASPGPSSERASPQYLGEACGEGGCVGLPAAHEDGDAPEDATASEDATAHEDAAAHEDGEELPPASCCDAVPIPPGHRRIGCIEPDGTVVMTQPYMSISAIFNADPPSPLPPGQYLPQMTVVGPSGELCNLRKQEAHLLSNSTLNPPEVEGAVCYRAFSGDCDFLLGSVASGSQASASLPMTSLVVDPRLVCVGLLPSAQTVGTFGGAWVGNVAQQDPISFRTCVQVTGVACPDYVRNELTGKIAALQNKMNDIVAQIHAASGQPATEANYAAWVELLREYARIGNLMAPLARRWQQLQCGELN